MAKHLLKLNDIENQFRELTNRFEKLILKWTNCQSVSQKFNQILK